MSAESDFLDVLEAYAPLTALVGTRIAQNAITQGAQTPYVVFTAAHDPQQLLLGVADDRVTLTTQCWGANAAQASAVADQVEAAVAAFDQAGTPASTSATVLSRQSAYDSETGLDGEILDIEWWP